jgi:DNA-binding NarL/FixJ family response regulator
VTLRCLVADDHPALVQAITDYLASSDVDVVGTAPDGERAVALASETRPDVAIVDFRMPRLAGVELLGLLREVSPETRLVVYTADAEVGRPMLTDREVSVLSLLAEGMSHEQIGEQLSISGETVRTHVRKASDRLGATTRTEAVAKALRLGLIS